MDKHRLELFSDGVFAIVLTLMVLDLKTPTHWDVTGLREMAPGMLVHALAFSLVGIGWIAHHNVLTRVRRVKLGTLWFNMIWLFFITLVPYGTRLSTENPLAPLGGMILCLCYAGASLAGLLMTRYFHAEGVTHTADEQQFARWAQRVSLTYTMASLFLAGLCWASAWFGYLGVLALTLGNLANMRSVGSTAQLPVEEAANGGMID